MTPPDPAREPEPQLPSSSSSPPFRGNRRGPAPVPVLAPSPWSWLLRTTALSTFVAAVVGVVIAPGLRGLASDRVVDTSNRLAWTLAYFVTGLLMTAVVCAVLELSRGSWARNPWNAVAVSVGGLVVVLAVPALLGPLPMPIGAALAIVASVTAAVGGLRGLQKGHTRAVGALMLSMAIAAFLRVVAWELARRAGDAGNTALYTAARIVATVGLGFEGVGQMVAAAWLGTRSRFMGQALSSAAIGLAWVLTYAAAAGASVTAHPWQVAAHIALATATGLPQPYGPTGLAVFLLTGSILLAGVAAAQRGQAVAVIAALALSLIGRGELDIPIHALAATAASLWLVVAGSDERAMWQSILATRQGSPSRPGLPPRRPASSAGET